MSLTAKGVLLFNTVKYLKPKQLMNQVLIRFKPNELFSKYLKQNVSHIECDLWVNELDGDDEYIERFKPDDLIDNKLTLLHETREFDRWHFDDASHLWNFNVHYLEYLVALKAKYIKTRDERYKEKLNEILENWYLEGITDSDSNQAYTISLRIVNQLLIADVVADKQKLYDFIYAQYRFLILHQEIHLLGNHYLENIKTIVICSVLFSEEDVYKQYIKKLNKELDKEITQDGLHFELSLMYHKIVMDDLIRVALLLKEAKKTEYKAILQKLKSMTTALYSLEEGISRTLLFNDAGEGVAKTTKVLLNTCRYLFEIKAEKMRNIAGYYRLDDGKITVVVDCGELAPTYMPGHSHCDCLSFEMFYDGRPIIVNSGTYQYQCKYRNYFRSTAAHNTVMINEHEQSELWGEHRAGRRIRDIKVKVADTTIIGEYKNIKNERHRRILSLEKGIFEVIDIINGNVESYLHLAPDCEYKDGVITYRDIKIMVKAIDADVRVEDSLYSPEFGIIEKTKSLVFSWKDDEKKHGYTINLKEINGND